MNTYEVLREFAASWAMLALFVFFICVVIWAYRPGSRKTHEDIANIPFRHEDRPAPSGGPDRSDRVGKAKEA
jgi:cytochrome c oxidase cbb3-type subunit 4